MSNDSGVFCYDFTVDDMLAISVMEAAIELAGMSGAITPEQVDWHSDNQRWLVELFQEDVFGRADELLSRGPIPGDTVQVTRDDVPRSLAKHLATHLRVLMFDIRASPIGATVPNPPDIVLNTVARISAAANAAS